MSFQLVVAFMILSLGIISVDCQTPKYNWTQPESLNIGLPNSAQIFTLNQTASPFGTKLTGAFIRFNMQDKNLQFKIRDASGDKNGYQLKTPEQYAKEDENVVYAVINGGYFNMEKNISASFIEENNKVKSNNSLNTQQQKFINPTVGAIGQTQQNKFEIQYIYSFGNQMQTYKYSLPNKYPGPPPSKQSGNIWDIQEGIGGGPILLKNNQIITGNIENFDQGYILEMRHPRSAICLDISGNLLLVAIDGYGYSQGVKISELADIMLNLNCKDAMNLDGGGSTCLYANNRIINNPADEDGVRKVVSVITVRDRYRKKQLQNLRANVI